MVFAAIFIPSLIYRWSLKSTSIIWSPLLWVITSARQTGPIYYRLHEVCNTAMYKTMRIYSIVVLATFAWKVALLLGWAKVSDFIQNTSFAELVMPYIAPAQLPLWQVAAAASAVLAWLLYFLADLHLKAIEVANPNRASEISLDAQIAAITVARNTLALYTTACTLYITWQIAASIEWPVVEFVVFPWSG